MPDQASCCSCHGRAGRSSIACSSRPWRPTGCSATPTALHCKHILRVRGLRAAPPSASAMSVKAANTRCRRCTGTPPARGASWRRNRSDSGRLELLSLEHYLCCEFCETIEIKYHQIAASLLNYIHTCSVGVVHTCSVGDGCCRETPNPTGPPRCTFHHA